MIPKPCDDPRHYATFEQRPADQPCPCNLMVLTRETITMAVTLGRSFGYEVMRKAIAGYRQSYFRNETPGVHLLNYAQAVADLCARTSTTDIDHACGYAGRVQPICPDRADRHVEAVDQDRDWVDVPMCRECAIHYMTEQYGERR